MELDKRSFIVLLVLAIITTLACSLPFNLPSQATPTQAASVSGPVQTNPAVFPPTLAPSISFTLEPSLTPTLKPVDLSNVVVRLADLPKGFSELDSEAQKQIGVSQETIASSFEKNFSVAKVSNFFSFLNANTDTYQVILGSLFTPLTESEIKDFDTLFDNPPKALERFTSGIGGKAEILQGANIFGEKSFGYSFTYDVDIMTLRSDVIIAHRKEVMFLVMSIYQDGTQPLTQDIKVAQLLDQRLADALVR